MAVKKTIGDSNLEKAIVIFDTSILYANDPSRLVCKEFEDFLSIAKEKSRIRLYLPELLVKELVQQKTALCNEYEGQVQAGLDKIFESTGKRYTTKAVDAPYRNILDARLRKWLTRRRVKVRPTPYVSVKPKEIEKRALEGLPPFEVYTKDSRKGDKGIKDFLILITVVKLHEAFPKEKLVFVANDERLLDAFEEKLGDVKTCHKFSDLDSYLSEIQLTYDQVSVQRKKSILSAAKDRFYDFKKGTGLYKDKKVPSRVAEKFGEAISKMPSSANLFPDFYTYVPAGPSRWELAEPRYLDQVDGRFRFRSKLTHIRVFDLKSNLPLLQGSQPDVSDRRNLETVFHVLWSAQIGTDGRFLKMAVDDIQLAGQSAKSDTEHQPTLARLLGSAKPPERHMVMQDDLERIIAEIDGD